MKIRNGFVSNSSSSSFIIGLLDQEAKRCPTCGHLPNSNLLEQLERAESNNYNTEVRWTNISARIEEEKSWNSNWNYSEFSDDEEAESPSELKQIKKQMQPGEQVIGCDVCNHDSDLRDLIDELEEQGVIKIYYRGEMW